MQNTNLTIYIHLKGSKWLIFAYVRTKANTRECQHLSNIKKLPLFKIKRIHADFLRSVRVSKTTLSVNDCFLNRLCITTVLYNKPLFIIRTTVSLRCPCFYSGHVLEDCWFWLVVAIVWLGEGWGCQSHRFICEDIKFLYDEWRNFTKVVATY